MPRPRIDLETKRRLFRVVREETGIEAHESPSFEEAVVALLDEVESQPEVQQGEIPNSDVRTIGDDPFGNDRGSFR